MHKTRGHDVARRWQRATIATLYLTALTAAAAFYATWRSIWGPTWLLTAEWALTAVFAFVVASCLTVVAAMFAKNSRDELETSTASVEAFLRSATSTPKETP